MPVLEEAFLACGIDYYLVGALARDVWYANGGKAFRATKDVDVAVLVGSAEQYEHVRRYLVENKGYALSATNDLVVIAPDHTSIDLLPFGGVDIDGNIIKGEAKTLKRIKQNGLMEVYKSGTDQIEVIEGRTFEVATLPAIVLLKFIAYDDRPEVRTKDASDIANIITRYFDLHADLVYSEHYDLFAEEQPNRSLVFVAATVIGREMGKILSENETLHKRIGSIIEGHISTWEKSKFVKQMALETDMAMDTVRGMLAGILEGLQRT